MSITPFKCHIGNQKICKPAGRYSKPDKCNAKPGRKNQSNCQIQNISAELENAKLPPEALIVELTESALLEDNSNARHFLKELRKAGIRLALDDFGTGYSNFHYLNELRPDIIKIDRSFTAQTIKDAKEYDLLKRFCTMIHRLNIKICIEGVETEDEWEKIRLLLPDYSQGYLWGKPCSFDELLDKFYPSKA